MKKFLGLLTSLILSTIVFSCYDDSKQAKSLDTGNDSVQIEHTEQFKEFLKENNFEESTDGYIYEGDIEFSYGIVEQLYLEQLQKENDSMTRGNIANDSNKNRYVWTDNEKFNITYRFTTNMETDNLTDEEVRDAFRQAAAAWNSATNLNIREVTTDALINVYTVNDPSAPWSAISFFPHAKYEYRVTYNRAADSYYSTKETMVGVFSHELGHCLGLAHEHQRKDAPSNLGFGVYGEPYGDYDPASIMHYGNRPYTSGISAGDISLVEYLYGYYTLFSFDAYAFGAYVSSDRFLPMDVDGDGKDDIIEINQNGSSWRAKFWKSDGSTLISTGSEYAFGAYVSSDYFLPMDVDGDGKDDIIEIYKNGSYWQAKFWKSDGSTLISTGSDYAFGVYASSDRFLSMDVDGDGKDDIIEIYKNGSYWQAKFWKSDGSTLISTGSDYAFGVYASSDRFLPMDVDGDGKDDIIELNQSSSSWKARLWKSDGSTLISTGSDYAFGTYVSSDRFLPMDLDGDGKDDIIELSQSGSSWKVQWWQSNGSILVPTGSGRIFGAYVSTDRFLPVDVDGDGKVDIGEIFKNSTSAMMRWWKSL